MGNGLKGVRCDRWLNKHWIGGEGSSRAGKSKTMFVIMVIVNITLPFETLSNQEKSK